MKAVTESMDSRPHALILAAGRGTRLGEAARDIPKGMVRFNDIPILERQIQVLRRAGINSIAVARGFAADKIAFDGVRYYLNPDFAETNMVETLFCSRAEMYGTLIVSYADILYEPRVLQGLMYAPGEIVVTADRDWREYWTLRYGTCDDDCESLTVRPDGSIQGLGESRRSAEGLSHRYVGLLKFTAQGLERIQKIYSRDRDAYWNHGWQVSGKPFKQAYMTDLIQAAIDDGADVRVCETSHGWLEFDRPEDLRVGSRIVQSPHLSHLFRS